MTTDSAVEAFAVHCQATVAPNVAARQSAVGAPSGTAKKLGSSCAKVRSAPGTVSTSTTPRQWRQASKKVCWVNTRSAHSTHKRRAQPLQCQAAGARGWVEQREAEVTVTNAGGSLRLLASSVATTWIASCC